MTAIQTHRDVASLSDRERVTVFIALLASVSAAGFAIGGVIPLVTFILERRGVPAALIGVNAAIPVLAVIIVSIFLGRLSRAIGIKAVLFTGLFITALSTLLMPYWTSLEAWMFLRFMSGVGAGAHWILSETWINAVAPNNKRGLYAGIYSTLFTVGFVVSPIALSFMDLDSALPFYLMIVLMLFSALPLWLARNLLPDVTAHSGSPAWSMLLAAPIVFAAAIAAGLNDSALWALLGLYGLRHGLSEADALTLLSVFASGTVALQLPLGWLADRGGLARYLLASAAAGAIGAAALPFVVGSAGFLWVHLFIWGGLMIGLYTLGLAQLGERFQGPSLVGANALYISIYAVGSMTGPPLYGAAMDTFGPNALPVGVLACCLLMMAAGLGRRRQPRVG